MKVNEKTLAEAYLLGSYLGDGHCLWRTNDPQHHVYQFVMPSIDSDLLNKVCDSIYCLFPELYGRVVIEMVTEKRNHEVLRCSSKSLCQFLRSRCDIKKRLPLLSDTTLFREFVAGLMDTDGWITQNVYKNINRWQMGFATTAPWYFLLRKCLQQEGVKVGSTQMVWKPKDKQDKWADCHRMYINIASFVDAGFYFSIVRKQNRLENWQRYMRGELSTTTRSAPTHA